MIGPRPSLHQHHLHAIGAVLYRLAGNMFVLIFAPLSIPMPMRPVATTGEQLCPMAGGDRSQLSSGSQHHSAAVCWDTRYLPWERLPDGQASIRRSSGPKSKGALHPAYPRRLQRNSLELWKLSSPHQDDVRL